MTPQHLLVSMLQVREEYGKLSSVLNTLNEKVSGVLARREREFLAAYRAHMFNVQKELQDLRNKVAEAATSLQKDDKIHKLEEERDWYSSACSTFVRLFYLNNISGLCLIYIGIARRPFA